MIDTVVHDVKICVHIFSFTLTLYFCYTGSFQHYIIQLHGRKKIWGGGVGTGTWLADISCLETFQFQSISTPGTCLAESDWQPVNFHVSRICLADFNLDISGMCLAECLEVDWNQPGKENFDVWKRSNSSQFPCIRSRIFDWNFSKGDYTAFFIMLNLKVSKSKDT